MSRIPFRLADGFPISQPLPDLPGPRVALQMGDMWKTKGVVVVRDMLDPELCAQRRDHEVVSDVRITQLAEHLLGVERFAIEVGTNPRLSWEQQPLPSWLAHRGLRVVVALSPMRLSDGPIQYARGSHNWFEAIRYELLDDTRRHLLRETMNSLMEQNTGKIVSLTFQPGDVAFIHGAVLWRRAEPGPGAHFEAICAELYESQLDSEEPT